MKPARIYRGDTWQRTWIAKTSAGVVIDLTGATARLHLRDSSGALKLSYTSASAALTITPASGRIDLSAPYADMEGIAPGTYYFDVEVTDSAGVRRTYEVNTLQVLADVSYGS